MVVLQRITPSRLTLPKFAPVKSAPVKLVGDISELVSLSVVAVKLLPSNPYQITDKENNIIKIRNLFIALHRIKIGFNNPELL
jgi:hypothetical protein